MQRWFSLFLATLLFIVTNIILSSYDKNDGKQKIGFRLQLTTFGYEVKFLDPDLDLDLDLDHLQNLTDCFLFQAVRFPNNFFDTIHNF